MPDPDALERLWTPHRMAYVRGENKPDDPSVDACPFCRAPGRDDAEGLIVHRGDSAYVVMNLYPYTSGHVLVCPYRHVPDYVDATEDEVAEIAALTRAAVRALKRVASPEGFNIGMNQGVAGGAGIAAHLHQHVVPRWVGDANFMPVIGRTKTMPALLEDTRELLASVWD